MSLFDPTTADVSNISYGLETSAALSGDKSIFESAGDVITKGIPLTGLSVLNSFANTGIAVANWFGADVEKLNVKDQVNDDYYDYYESHEQGIEAAGLISGSLIPGMAAIKVLKLAQAGKMTATMARATNIFAGPRDKIVQGALQEIESSGLYPSLAADKYKAIALGFGDQALQALAYETATIATMKQSPLLEKDGLKDVVENMFFGALLGGGVGGVLEGIGTRAIFNKSLLLSDLNTKTQELATYLGTDRVGGRAYITGDRVVELLDSLDKIPESVGILGSKKAAATRDAGILNSKLILQNLVNNEDKEVTNSLFDTLWKMKTEGGMGKEEIYNYLARLARASRITDDLVPVENGTEFYVNRFAKGKNPGWDDLVTPHPGENADLSLRYKLREFQTSPSIARFDDMVEWEGQKVAKYKNAGEAFKDDHDLFIDKDGKIFVNKDAPSIERVARPGESRPLTIKEELQYRKTGQLPEKSRPLYGAPLVLDVTNGNMLESAIPVVGDYGKVEVFDKGLRYGNKTSLQTVDSVLTKDTATEDANARYVWAAQRGVKAGDVINPTDAPMLEAMYREGSESGNWAAYITKLGKQGVRFSDDTSLPVTPDELLKKIAWAKNDLIHDLIGDGTSKLSAEEVALRANVPQSYLENGLKFSQPEELMVNPEKWSSINHVRLEYDVGNIFQQDGQILRGQIDVQYRIQVIKDAIRAGVSKFFGADTEKFLATKTAADANITGVGPKAFSFSNAPYGSLGQEMERIGKFVTDWAAKRMAAISETLAPATNAIRNDPAASAELGFFRAVRQRTGADYTFLPPDLAEKYGVSENTVVLRDSLKFDKKAGGVATEWDQNYAPDGFLPWSAKTDRAGLTAEYAKGLHAGYELSPKVADFERANQQVNDFRIRALNNWYSAQGLNRYIEPGSLYTPPIDTAKYPHVALVRQRPGMGMADDSVSAIVGETAADLQQKIAALRDEFQVFTKSDIKKYHQVEGDYDYNRNFAQSYVNTALQRRGILHDVFPDTRSETIIKDYIDWHSRQELRLVRDHVELGNAQLFAELRAMGERFTAPEISKTGFVASFLGKTAKNPYDDYIKTALGISEKENYRLWADANEKVEAFFSSAFRMAKSAFTAAKSGLLPYEDASKMAERFGLGNPYGNGVDAIKAYYDVANKLPPERYLSKFVATANSVLSATAIRLDVFQSVINAISTPVLLTAEANSARQLMTTELPDGSGRSIPATSKLLYQALNNWFSKDARDQWMPLYKDIGAVRDKSSEYFQMIDHLTLPYGKFSDSKLLGSINSAVELGSKLTGSNLSEEFARFIAADTGRQIFEAAGYGGQQLTDNIATFVNRVHGNYIASQRPIAFQGPIGQAVGLFQTYQFNLMQQLFRYVENGEAKTIATLAGIQTSLFGFQGLPGFQAINNHIVGTAANNPSHKDIYSVVPQFFDKKLGDYLLYGVVSNWLNTGVYSRGDINPRQITVLPFNPLDYPAISGGIRFVGEMLDTANKISQGASVPSALLLGLEHNGLSRPLSGIAQMVQGVATTSKGSLVAVTRPGLEDNSAGLSDVISAASFSRILGARPLDEAVTMDALYRKTLYTAKDNARIAELGEAAKSKLYGNGSLQDDDIRDFASRYAASGGQIQNFGKEIVKWSNDANASVANQIFRSLKKPVNQQMMIIMGGQPLPDFSHQPSLAPASP